MHSSFNLSKLISYVHVFIFNVRVSLAKVALMDHLERKDIQDLKEEKESLESADFKVQVDLMV